MKLETAFSDGGESIPVIFSEMGKNLPSAFGNVQTIHNGRNGATFTPSVSEDGVISWTNDRELPNPEPVNIKGPKGDTGPQGPRGEKGNTGEAGPTGPQGVAGPQGPTGPQGPQGVQGVKGETGSQGERGPAGEQGPQGPQGVKGADGVSPVVTVTAIEGGHRVTITDKNGAKTFDVMDGEDGEDAEGGGTVHWDDVQGKPFGDMPTGGDALQWDGNIDGLLAVTAANRFGEVRTFYKVSDAFPTWGDILQGDFTEVVCRVKKGSETLAEFQSEEEMTAMVDDCLRELGVADDYTVDERGKIAVIINEIVCVMEDNYTHGNFVFPEKGTYFSTNVDYLWFRGCTSFPSTKLMDEKYLPMDDITAAVIAALPIYNGEVEEV